MDADGDGICDPGAPSSGPSACDPDSDGDGIGDTSDLCSGTATGGAVDANGCSDVQVDFDNDGVCDQGAPSSGPSGCEPDSDGDGVGNNLDLCPGTGEEAEDVDINGCSEDQINQAPVAVAQDVTVSVDASCQATVTAADVDNGSSDPDGDPITLSISPSGPFSLGATNVTLTVSDGTAQSTADAIVTLEDNSVPALTAPVDMMVTENVPGGWSGSIGTPTGVADNCDGNPTITNNAPTIFPPGNTTVEWKAEDASGNFDTDTQVVTVNALDSDGDGVNDDVDPFINSNRGSTVVIDGCDSNVGNQDLGDGSTFNDRIGAIIARNHGDFLKQLNVLTNKWKKDGLITKNDKGEITACA